MRIISGTLKGKKILSQEGQDTRPTSDKNRQSLFNIICHNYFSQNLTGVSVLDIFAGSGALGLEALSRGALKACFVENNKKALYYINENIKNCRLEKQSEIIKSDATNLANLKNECFSLIFIDPPYHKNLIEPTLNNLIKNHFINNETILVIETAKDESINLPENGIIDDQRSYGITKFSFMKIKSF
ncbi:MAG: 16S rRNA (guanine(966)-N(2))-methyltransferase RsmD [Alphaproteobacteria bacterium]